MTDDRFDVLSELLEANVALDAHRFLELADVLDASNDDPWRRLVRPLVAALSLCLDNAERGGRQVDVDYVEWLAHANVDRWADVVILNEELIQGTILIYLDPQLLASWPVDLFCYYALIVIAGLTAYWSRGERNELLEIALVHADESDARRARAAASGETPAAE